MAEITGNRIILTRETEKVKQFLREREDRTYEDHLKIADELGLGRGVILDKFDRPYTDTLTGRGLCLYASANLRADMSKEFPDIKVTIVTGGVKTRDAAKGWSEPIGHFWTRLLLEDQTLLFADDTYGQIHPFLNRPVVDFAHREPDYYGSRGYPFTETRNPAEILEDLHKTTARTVRDRNLIYSH